MGIVTCFGEAINDPGKGLFGGEIGIGVDISSEDSDGVGVEVKSFIDAAFDDLEGFGTGLF